MRFRDALFQFGIIFKFRKNLLIIIIYSRSDEKASFNTGYSVRLLQPPTGRLMGSK